MLIVFNYQKRVHSANCSCFLFIDFKNIPKIVYKQRINLLKSIMLKSKRSLTEAMIPVPQCSNPLERLALNLQSMRNLHLECKGDYPTPQLAWTAYTQK